MKRVHQHSDGARDTVMVNSVGSNDLRTVLRFSKDETVARGAFQKSYLHSDYPIFTLDLLGSLKGIGKNEYSYFRSEFTIDYKLKIPPLGMSKIKLTAGKIVGTVPYPLLKLHEGKGTYILDQSSFRYLGHIVLGTQFRRLLPGEDSPHKEDEDARGIHAQSGLRHPLTEE